MKLAYVDNTPLKNYKIYKEIKDIELPDDIKVKFNNYYKEIEESSDLKVDEWTKKAGELKGLVESEISKKGNNKSIYVKDFAEFIFGVSYLLFDKFKLSQSKVSKILKISESTFSKLDIFPYRCYQACTKLADRNKRKSFMPNETDSIGIRIAECINNKIQARYACSAFIGVSNNLDVFVSIASTDNKKFIMTIPCTANDKQELRLKQNIGFARFLFATANNMENVKGRYLSGKIKNKIVELLDMQDNTLLYKSKRLEDMLKEGEEYRDYLKDDSDMQSIYDYRNLFRKYSIMEDEEQLPYIDEDYDEDYYTDYGIEYSVEYIEDNLEIILEETSRRLEEMKNNIIGNMTYFDGGFSVEKFEDYRECMLKVLYYDFEIEEKGDIPVVCCNMDEEMKILCASIYWVLLAVGEGEVKKEKIEELHKYMRTKNMLAYFDAINKEFDEKGETHTLLKMDSFNILEVIDEVCTKRQKYQRPIMLYIDVEAYPNITNYLDDILKGYGVIIIICDVNKTLSNYNLQILDEELDLYYAEGVCNGV